MIELPVLYEFKFKYRQTVLVTADIALNVGSGTTGPWVQPHPRELSTYCIKPL